MRTKQGRSVFRLVKRDATQRSYVDANGCEKGEKRDGIWKKTERRVVKMDAGYIIRCTIL